MKITVDQIMAWRPCSEYTRERVTELIGKGKTPLQIAKLKISAQDRLWVLLREEIIPARELHLLACDFAQAVAHLNPDPRVQAAIDAKRLWVDGKITDAQLAAAEAAWVAAGEAACAAWEAVWAAAGEAAWTAGADAAARAADAVVPPAAEEPRGPTSL